MLKKNFSIILVLKATILLSLSAQTLPLVYDVENSVTNFPKPRVLSLSELPVIQSLPDPFRWADGRGRISYYSDWGYRRVEIGAHVQNYEIGEKPTRPDTITADYLNGVLTVNVTVNGKTLTLTSSVVLPSGTGPFPAVIGINSSSGSLPTTIFSSRNIARITFSHNQVTVYGNPKNTDPYYRLYPHLNVDNTGQYSAWAWGVSRIIDGLELVKDKLPIDLKHLAVTGCSYAGKLALFAGAFDERIALTIAQESGGGGATSWRFSHTETVSVEKIDNTDYNWFMNSMKQFSGDNVYKLPIDHHELMAMCAPRALLVTANTDYTWLSNQSCYVASMATKKVYDALNISDRFGFVIDGGHSHCQVPNSQIPVIEAFVEKFLLRNNSVNTNVAETPYNTNLSPWITWTTPTLSNGNSYFGRTSLLSPDNNAKGLNKNVTFKWNKVLDAAKYFIQIALDPIFNNIVINDSTTIDTLKTYQLADGKKYYWRVRVKSTNNLSGPFSDVWMFTTFIDLPSAPSLVSALQYSNRQGSYTFIWKSVKNVDKYFIQIAGNSNFNFAFMDSTTSDTVKTIHGFYEGTRYYWRVRAMNVSGYSSWSETKSFSTLLAPTNLTLELTGPKQITLKWNIDNSSSATGYIIERKQAPQKEFLFLDSLKQTKTEYVDSKIESSQTYTYRVKAYNNNTESDYSNEASLTLVGIKQKTVPTQYSINQNFPNPFNPTTKVDFALPEKSFTKLTIYDSIGREIKTLIEKELEAGEYQVYFDGENLSSEIYYYKIQAGNWFKVKKMVLMK